MWPRQAARRDETWAGDLPGAECVPLPSSPGTGKWASFLSHTVCAFILSTCAQPRGLFLVTQLPLRIKSFGVLRLLCNCLKNSSQEVKRQFFRAGGTRSATLAMQSRSTLLLGLLYGPGACFLPARYSGLVTSNPGHRSRLVPSQLCRPCLHSLEHTLSLVTNQAVPSQPCIHGQACPLMALHTGRPVSTGPGLQGASPHEK